MSLKVCCSFTCSLLGRQFFSRLVARRDGVWRLNRHAPKVMNILESHLMNQNTNVISLSVQQQVQEMDVIRQTVFQLEAAHTAMKQKCAFFPHPPFLPNLARITRAHARNSSAARPPTHRPDPMETVHR